MSKSLLLALLCLCLTGQTFAQSDPLRLIVTDAADDANSRDSNPGDGVCEDDAGRCTLRAAVDEANAATGEVVIVVPGRLPGGNTGTYTLSRVAPNTTLNTYEDANAYGDLDLNGSFTKVILQGTGVPGPQITISPNDRILDIGSGKVVDIERIWFSGGTARQGSNGNPDGSGDAGVDGEDGEDGGALYVGSTAMVNIDQCTFSGNTTQSGGNGATPSNASVGTQGGDAGNGGDGGAIYISTGAMVTINRSTLSGNGTGDAGGAGSGLGTGGNPAQGGNGGDGGNGGAIYNAGMLTLKNVTIGNNTCGDPGAGGGGGNGGNTGNPGSGGSGGGVANAQLIDLLLTVQGSATLENTIIAQNTAGDDQTNGKQPGKNLYDGDSEGTTFTSQDYNLLGSNEGVMNFNGQANDQVGTSTSEIDPLFQGQNQGGDEAVPTLVLGSGSPAINAGTNTDGPNNFDARGFERPADGQADIGAYENNSQRIPASLQISELDVASSSQNDEFVEIMNNGDYPVQMDEFVVVAFNSGGTACFVSNLYGELLPGEMYVLGDMGVDKSNQMLTLDATSNSCSGSSGSQFVDDNGAVGLYRGDGSNFNGISAGGQSSSREDVIVYDNTNGLTGGGDSNRSVVLMDLCSNFGLSTGCAASDDGDNSSIQRDAIGNLITGTPSPGETNSAVLPVELLNFTATVTSEQTALLRWATLLELNNAGFAVEQFNAAAKEWQEIGWVAGSGTTESKTDYRFETPYLDAGTHLFRLRQVDLDGMENLLPTVSVNVRGASDRPVLFPNPTAGRLTLQVPETGFSENVRIEVFNVHGQRVLELDGGPGLNTSGIQLDFSRLSAGTYRLRMLDGVRTEVLTFTKR